MPTRQEHANGLFHFCEAPAPARRFDARSEVVFLEGDAAQTLKTIPDEAIKLVITSPPYNIGKAYEKATHLAKYLDNLSPVVDQLIRVLAADGSLCWQVGNYRTAKHRYPARGAICRTRIKRCYSNSYASALAH